MIKRTLYFGNPAYLSLSDAQLLVRLPEVEKNDLLPEHFKKEAVAQIPIEDIGIILLDHQQITITQGILELLLENNVAIITCNSTHHPVGLLLPLSSNTVQNERYRAQLDATEPLKKQLWQQTVIQKIKNQSSVLATQHIENSFLIALYQNVKSGDSNNCEATAAAYYWKYLAPALSKGEGEFRRLREGLPPNNYLNYGYAILRGVVARSLVGSGMATFAGIHHRNKYNPYCLADDIMEPYRPYVDKVVLDILTEETEVEELTPSIKKKLLVIPAMDVILDNQNSPLMVATQRTSASLMDCFEGTSRKILYPVLKI